MINSFIVIFLSFLIFINYANLVCVEATHVYGRRSHSNGMHGNGARRAVAVLRGDAGVSGIIYFQQGSGGSITTISGSVSGLTPGLHGFHVHQYGDQTNGCTSAGDHYNPFGKTHGGPNDRIKHIGDLGNIVAGANGVAEVYINSYDIKLRGPLSVIGHSLVVHANTDDLGQGTGNMREESLKTGNAGSRLACGVIGIAAVS
nr:RecName: Full=Extracellular superoxide dismutase [Cu-Zn]; Short=EC-SOD; Flags: Precursor [Onchocerca volvulus]AAA17049.1 Cu-Zn extracellular superoxide dismutase [Onchocerca volvulus]